MCNRVTLHFATAKLIICSNSESVRKPCSKGVYVEVHLRGVSQVSIWNISRKIALGCSHDDLCELQPPSVCVAPADCDHTIRRRWYTRTHRSRDWGQEGNQLGSWVIWLTFTGHNGARIQLLYIYEQSPTERISSGTDIETHHFSD